MCCAFGAGGLLCMLTTVLLSGTGGVYGASESWDSIER